MWEIFEKKEVAKSLKKAPIEVIKKYEIWKRIVEIQGTYGLRLIRGFRDEKLRGDLDGMRSSRLNYQWRVVYKIEEECLRVLVIEINPHKY